MHSRTPVHRCGSAVAGFTAALGIMTASLSMAATFTFGPQTFTIPDGFVLEQVAGPPLVDRPISASFDEQGRLYLTDSSGSNEKVEKQLADKPHRVVRLEDTNGDGRFDKTTTFADRMMFPEGCLWFEGSLYVAAPPSIWKLTDSNEDGQADLREEWHQGKTLTGCANDLHGPFLGPDGWIYWCKGAFAEQTYPLPGGGQFKSKAAHVFRKRPDGSGLEPVLTGGMDNPVSLAFSRSGERFVVGTFFQQPEAGKRDGILHAVYGGVYGKVHDVINNHKRTGDIMPIMTHMGPAAPCSIIRYRSPSFGADYRDNMFVCAFNLHKITRHILEPAGGTFRTRDLDFMTSDHPDFHPTDVIEDADGSLLVIDTGGWYKLCCPTSQLSKPDVLGGVYRIRRKDAPKIVDARGTQLVWSNLPPQELVQFLDDTRPYVTALAMDQLVKRGSRALPALLMAMRNGPSITARCNAVWTLGRFEQVPAKQGVELALRDTDDNVRTTAIHVTAMQRNPAAASALQTVLKVGAPGSQRAAAEALGRLGDKSAVPALLAASAMPHDRVLEHSLIYALIELNDASATSAGLKDESSLTCRAALIALDQMENGNLSPAQVIPLLNSKEAVLRDTAFWIVARHNDWGKDMAAYFREQLDKPNAATEQDALRSQLAHFARDREVQDVLFGALQRTGSPADLRKLILLSMSQATVKEPSAPWLEAVVVGLADEDQSVLRAAVAAARSLANAKGSRKNLTTALLRVAQKEANPDALRMEALAALPSGVAMSEGSLFTFLRTQLDSSKPAMVRDRAARLLARSKLSDAQLLELTQNLPAAGPLEITQLLPAFSQGTNETIGLKFVAALGEAKGFGALQPDQVRSHLTNYPAAVQEKGEQLATRLNINSARQKTHLEEMLQSLPQGDIRRGQSVFNSTKAACAACHAIGYLGGRVGPDLTRIGQIRTERDLLEALLFPSASFVRSYEPWIVSTHDGEDHSGVLRQDTADEVVLATGPETEVRLARADVVDLRPGKLSVMPQGLDEQLTKTELADLLAFLRATRW